MVRYILKKMGQGWSTIIVFINGKENVGLNLEPINPRATVF